MSEDSGHRLSPSAHSQISDLLNGPSADRLWLFLIGFLIASAFFLVEAGAAEIMQARRAACLEGLANFRLAPDPNEACMSEFQYFLTNAMSRGLFTVVGPDPAPMLAWPVMAVLYGLLGGAVAQMRPTHAVGVYLGAHLMLLMVLMSVDFLSQFIV